MSLINMGHAGNTIEIPDEWYVLDIGSGHNAIKRADVISDLLDTKDAERGGQKIEVDSRFVNADIQSTPFKDSEFDLVIASHILEHVLDPLKAISELNRIAKRIYCETPSKTTELLMGEHSDTGDKSVHKWYVTKIAKDELLFEPIKVYRPLGKDFYNRYYHGDGTYRRLWVENRSLFYTFIYTENKLKCRIQND